MTWTRPVLLLCLASCGLLGPKKTRRVTKKVAPKPTIPAWTQQKSFYAVDEDTYQIYGVGQLPIPNVEKGDCPRSHVFANKALTMARERLTDVVGEKEVLGSEPAGGWLEGERTLFVYAKVETTTAPPDLEKLTRLKPEGGVTANEVVEAVRLAMLSRLDKDGICKDPHRRTKNKCCGGAERFCSDSTRYSRKIRADVCACGNEKPCLYDFRCERGTEGMRCVCRGKKCPCSILTCKDGERCSDGRCF